VLHTDSACIKKDRPGAADWTIDELKCLNQLAACGLLVADSDDSRRKDVALVLLGCRHADGGEVKVGVLHEPRRHSVIANVALHTFIVRVLAEISLVLIRFSVCMKYRGGERNEYIEK